MHTRSVCTRVFTYIIQISALRCVWYLELISTKDFEIKSWLLYHYLEIHLRYKTVNDLTVIVCLVCFRCWTNCINKITSVPAVFSWEEYHYLAPTLHLQLWANIKTTMLYSSGTNACAKIVTHARTRTHTHTHTLTAPPPLPLPTKSELNQTHNYQQKTDVLFINKV